MDFTFNEEMKSIKDSFQNDVNDVELEDDILTKRSKSDKESKDEAESYKKWLAGQKSEIEDPEIEDKMKGFRVFWNKDDLDDGRKFLKDYLLKRYKDNDQNDYVPSYDEIVHDNDDDLDEDEKNVKKQEEFEHEFNFRFEEPDEDFIKRYPGTIKDTLRKI
jgi:protein KRI1